MPELHILADAEALADEAADFVSNLAEDSVRERRRFTVALSGGSTPRKLYEVLASSPYRERIEWSDWQVFWGDERCVPPDHPDSNYLMAKETLLDQVPIPTDHAHRMRGEEQPQITAGEYEKLLRDVFGDSTPVMDLILLGLGEDGHTASLFPGSDALEERNRLVVSNFVPQLQTYRITFAYSLINSARNVAFLVAGESKAKVANDVLEPKLAGPKYPASSVCPFSGSLHWFLTEDAASRLSHRG